MKKYLTVIFTLFFMMTAASAQTGSWSGRLEVQGTSLPIVFHLDEDTPVMDSPDQGAKGIPIQIRRGAMGKIEISIPSIGATYEGRWTIKQIAGTFTQGPLSLPLTLMPGALVRNRPQTPQGPFPYSTEEVEFTNGEAVLKGTLVLPEGYDRNTVALVMVTGSGLQDRNEELYEHKPFAVIADALARAGIATLRYDDRGFGKSSGNAASATTEDFADDALAGISAMKERFDRVGVIGHSEGGTIAMMLAAQGSADFIVSLAGMVVSGKETLLAQNRSSLIEAGMTEESINNYCRLLEETFDAIVEGRPLPSAENKDIPDALKKNHAIAAAQLTTPYMKYFLALDMRDILHNITCPVLALNGTKDIQVDHACNLDALRSGLPSNAVNRIESIPGLNHLFQHCNTGSVSEYPEIEETFAPEVVELIVSWIRSSL